MRVWIFAILAIVFLAGCSENTSELEQEEEPTEEAIVEEDLTEDNNWEEKVKEIAAMDESEIYKSDEMESYAVIYELTDQELDEFTNYIIEEYESGKYLADTANHEYMLENLFKSLALYQHYEDQPLGDFAFNFYMNTRDVYCGFQEPDSSFVKTGEENMNKALEQME